MTNAAIETSTIPFLSSDWLMGIRSVVQVLVRTMFDRWYNLALCGIVGAKLIGDHYPRRSAVALQQLAHQTLDHLGVDPQRARASASCHGSKQWPRRDPLIAELTR
jgi:hypothetical protein